MGMMKISHTQNVVRSFYSFSFLKMKAITAASGVETNFSIARLV